MFRKDQNLKESHCTLHWPMTMEEGFAQEENSCLERFHSTPVLDCFLTFEGLSRLNRNLMGRLVLLARLKANQHKVCHSWYRMSDLELAAFHSWNTHDPLYP